jgi:hypothetical protein
MIRGITYRVLHALESMRMSIYIKVREMRLDEEFSIPKIYQSFIDHNCDGETV